MNSTLTYKNALPPQADVVLRNYLLCTAQTLRNVSIRECQSNQERLWYKTSVANFWYSSRELFAGHLSTDYIVSYSSLDTSPNFDNIGPYLKAFCNPQSPYWESTEANMELFTQYRDITADGIEGLQQHLPRLFAHADDAGDLYIRGCRDALRVIQERGIAHWDSRFEQLAVFKEIANSLVLSSELTPGVVAKLNLYFYLFLCDLLNDFKGSTKLPEYLSIIIRSCFDNELYNIIDRYFESVAETSALLYQNPQFLFDDVCRTAECIGGWLLELQDKCQLGKPAVSGKGDQLPVSVDRLVL